MGIWDYIMNYLTDEEKYVKGICNNNENMIIILKKTYPNSLLINSFFDDEFSSSSNFSYQPHQIHQMFFLNLL